MHNFTRLIAFAVFIFIGISNTQAQEVRYLNEVFTDVEISNPQPVASNYTILPFIFSMGQQGSLEQPLVIQTYTPAGDTATNRPLVIYLHTGNFFPFPQNGSCGGTMTDSTNVEIATRLAKMGYVVAVVNYRQGWNPFDPQELIRRFFLINAAYRGVQDVRTYVRFFKKSAVDLGNPYGIDPDKIALWGQGTGGYLSLAAAYLNDFAEISNTSDPNKFQLPTAAGLIPMVREEYNGNLGSTNDITTVDAQYNSYTLLPVGDTLSKPNHVTYNDGSLIEYGINLTVNMGGALGDSTWINEGEVPVVSYHVPSDAFAPYMTDVLNVPTPVGPQPVVEVSGSFTVQSISDRFGNNDIFKTIPDGFDPIGEARGQQHKGLLPFDNTPDDTSSPWEWTDLTNPDLMATNCNGDGEVARTYIDSVVMFFAPRGCVALGLQCFTSNVEDITDAQVGLVMGPNPTSSILNISAQENINAVELYTINGQLVRQMQDLNTNSLTLQRGDLTDGIYLVRLQFEQGIITKRVIFK